MKNQSGWRSKTIVSHIVSGADPKMGELSSIVDTFAKFRYKDNKWIGGSQPSRLWFGGSSIVRTRKNHEAFVLSKVLELRYMDKEEVALEELRNLVGGGASGGGDDDKKGT
uniref:Uncharacterized protein n=1 Tax=Cannabis sativa TaxID=3483 RepID=A0A803NT17_CANSA